GYAKDASPLTVVSCGNTKNVTATGTPASSGSYVAGIIGFSEQYISALTVKYCYNTGNITSAPGKCAAGIVGRMNFLSASTDGVQSIADGCYNSGTITGTALHTAQIFWSTTAANKRVIGTNFYLADSDDSLVAYTANGTTYNAIDNTDKSKPFTTAELQSGALAKMINDAMGKTVYYQNINEDGATKDAYPVTDPTHGYVFENGGKLYSLSFYTLKTASVRLNKDGVSGLRFSTAVNKADYAVLTKAEISLDFGTLITPNDYLTDPAKANNVFTADALNEGNYLDVNSTVTGTDVFNSDLKGADMEHDKYYYFCGSITDIKEANYDWDYSAIGYVTINDDIVYSGQYATRSIAYVANAAYYDRSDTPNDTYKYAIPANSEYAISEVASYSPYNPDAKDGAESELKTIRGYLLQD
ncbi:MAG: hypothetical protein IKJ00_09040, partial [Clostridia bacterium]|nr:hypothetical protein [Clostridia bacterium]